MRLFAAPFIRNVEPRFIAAQNKPKVSFPVTIFLLSVTLVYPLVTWSYPQVTRFWASVVWFYPSVTVIDHENVVTDGSVTPGTGIL